MITQEKWKWYGYPLHFICSTRCRFHLGTKVGKYIISTVGDYHSGHNGKPWEQTEREEIGCDRYFETFVFEVGGKRGSCKCPSLGSGELDTIAYGKDATCDELNAGHLRMCKKYARKQ